MELKTDFIVSPSRSISGQQDNDRIINLYPMKKSGRLSLVRTPGIRPYKSFNYRCFGVFNYDNNLYAVFRDFMLVVDSHGTEKRVETPALVTENVDFSGAPGFIYIVSGASSPWLYDVTHQKITIPEAFRMINASMVEYLDSRFYFVQTGTSYLWATDVLPHVDKLPSDGSSYLEVADMSSRISAIKSWIGQMYVFSHSEYQVYRDLPQKNTFVLKRINQVRGEIGCMNNRCHTSIGGALYFLGTGQKSSTSSMGLYAMMGFSPKKVSSPDIEGSINPVRSYAAPSLWSYGHHGNLFLGINNEQDTGYIYDISLGAWHERAIWDPMKGWNGMKVTGSAASSGKSYVILSNYPGMHILSDDDFTDPSGYSRWLVRWRAIKEEIPQKLRHNRLSLVLNSGTDKTDHSLADPDQLSGIVFLRYSDDSGYTWTTARPMSTGRYGDHNHLMKWYSLGYSHGTNDRYYELYGSGKTQKTLIDAWLDVTK